MDPLHHDILGMLIDRGILSDYVSEYGEPGYRLRAETGLVLIGDWWCRRADCSYSETYEDGRKRIHGVDYHYPRLFAALESLGCELEWSDEWVVDYNSGKCYRTEPDSYSWQSSILWTDGGEFLTPDDDIEAWIAELENDPRKALTAFSESELAAVGYEEYACGYEDGWYEKHDNPEEITAAIRRDRGDAVDILFYISGVEQFRVGFCAMVRERERSDV